jgi:hypothetical protein
MQTQSYTENIEQYILNEFLQAESSIQLAVPWFTNEKLFLLLCEKAKKGLAVELMLLDDNINKNSGNNYELLCNEGGKVWKIKTTVNNNQLINNKFCIIDNKTVIDGSYNWIDKTSQDHESITIISENVELALQFSDKFKYIKEHYFGKNSESIVVDYAVICSRLKALLESIHSRDTDDIEYLAGKLKKRIKLYKGDSLSEIYQIIKKIEEKHYAEAVIGINAFTQKFKTIIVYTDTEITALRLELRVLEFQISSLEDEKVELEKLIHEFEARYNHELGDILLKILRLRKEKLRVEAKNNPKKEKEYHEAEKDYQSYHENYNSLKEGQFFELSEEQKVELKSLYRRASKFCHPDAVDDKNKEEAEEIFKELNDAYTKNDIEKVRQILENLKTGIFRPGSETTNEKQKLSLRIFHFRDLRDALEKEIQKIKHHPTYELLNGIEDWDLYFSHLKDKLIKELDLLEK